MARTEARIFSTIWSAADQADFRSRSVGAQWLYFALLSQPELSMCGVLTEATGRWSHMAGNAKPKELAAWLAELHKHRFVIHDQATSEVWLRTFLRSGGVLRTPNLTVGMARDFLKIHSEAIRQGIVAELARDFGDDILHGIAERFPKAFPLPMPGGIADGMSYPIADGIEKRFPQGFRDAVHGPCNRASAGASAQARAAHAPVLEVTEVTRSLNPPPSRSDLRPEQPPSTSPEARPEEELLDAVWRRLGEHDLDAAIAEKPSYLKTTRERALPTFADRRRQQHHDQALAELRQQPGLDVDRLCEILTDGAVGPADGGRVRALQQAEADAARADADRAQADAVERWRAEGDAAIDAMPDDKRARLDEAARDQLAGEGIDRPLGILVRDRMRTIALGHPMPDPHPQEAHA